MPSTPPANYPAKSLPTAIQTAEVFATPAGCVTARALFRSFNAFLLAPGSIYLALLRLLCYRPKLYTATHSRVSVGKKND